IEARRHPTPVRRPFRTRSETFSFGQTIDDTWGPSAMSRRPMRNNKAGERVTPPTRLLDLPPEAEDQTEAGLPRDYWQACKLAEQGQYDEARGLYSKLADSKAGGSLP